MNLPECHRAYHNWRQLGVAGLDLLVRFYCTHCLAMTSRRLEPEPESHEVIENIEQHFAHFTQLGHRADEKC